MNHVYKTLNGETINDQRCVMPDHRETTLTINIRSQNALSMDRVRHLIQREFEVLGIVETGVTIYVR